MNVDRIIFWQPIDSPHQDAFLESVAERFPGDVVLGVERPFPPDRIAQGWPTPQHSRVNVVDLSRPEGFSSLAAHTSASSLHVFSGFFSHPLVWAGFHRLASSQARLAVYSEAPEQPLLTGWLKRARGRFLAARWSNRIAFVLAVGGVGCAFFAAIGFPREKILSFGYFLATPMSALVAREPGGPFRFISAGQLIRRKGVDLLIKACVSLPVEGWRLDIYGDGPERPALERLTSRLRLTDRIAFHGTVSNGSVTSLLAKADRTVLPSRFDGWGMLVNESLAAGTPVICTSQCGAASLVAQCGLAPATPPPAAAALARSLSRALTAGPPPAAIREQIRATVCERGSATSAAARFISISSA